VHYSSAGQLVSTKRKENTIEPHLMYAGASSLVITSRRYPYGTIRSLYSFTPLVTTRNAKRHPSKRYIHVCVFIDGSQIYVRYG